MIHFLRLGRYPSLGPALFLSISGLAGCGGETSLGEPEGSGSQPAELDDPAGSSGGSGAGSNLTGGASSAGGSASGGSASGGSGAGSGASGGDGTGGTETVMPCPSSGSCEEGQQCFTDACCPCFGTCYQGIWQVMCAACAVPACPSEPPTEGTKCDSCDPFPCEYCLDSVLTTFKCGDENKLVKEVVGDCD